MSTVASCPPRGMMLEWEIGRDCCDRRIQQRSRPAISTMSRLKMKDQSEAVTLEGKGKKRLAMIDVRSLEVEVFKSWILSRWPDVQRCGWVWLACGHAKPDPRIQIQELCYSLCLSGRRKEISHFHTDCDSFNECLLAYVHFLCPTISSIPYIRLLICW